MKTYDKLDEATLNEIMRRSANGESVALAIQGMELPLMDTLESLKRHHIDRVLAAKKEYRERV